MLVEVVDIPVAKVEENDALISIGNCFEIKLSFGVSQTY